MKQINRIWNLLKSATDWIKSFGIEDSFEVSFPYDYAGATPSAHAGQHPCTPFMYTCKQSGPFASMLVLADMAGIEVILQFGHILNLALLNQSHLLLLY